MPTPSIRSLHWLFAICVWSACNDLSPVAAPVPADTDVTQAEDPGFVKLMVVMDQSSSLQCVDSKNRRIEAFMELGAELDSRVDYSFAAVGFASWARVTGFTSDWSVVQRALPPQDNLLGSASDFQGALLRAKNVLQADMSVSPPADLERTTYAVVFIADGLPDPVCSVGCDDVEVFAVCNDEPESDDDYVAWPEDCPDYNQSHQILDGVQQIAALANRYVLRDLAVHTVLLHGSAPDIEAACGPGFDAGVHLSEPLLMQMAAEGDGLYQLVGVQPAMDLGRVVHPLLP